jgi:hypothetical protein
MGCRGELRSVAAAGSTTEVGDISESEMLAAGDIIELVAKIAVAPICQEMDQKGYALKRIIRIASAPERLWLTATGIASRIVE